MANKRIKDISTTATSPASDDFVVLDSSSNGTRKIAAGPLGGVFDETIKTGSGTFPVAALAGIQIANGASSYSYFSATDDTKQFAAGIDHTLSEGVVGMISNHGLRVVTNNTERLRIMSDGKFAYGHSSPNAEFSIKGDTEFLDGDTGTRIGLLYDNGTEGIFELRDNNVTKVQLRSAGDSYFNGGNVGISNSSPTRKLELKKTGFLGSSTLGSPTDSTVSIDVRGNASTDIIQGEVLGAYTLDAYDSSTATGGGVTQNSGMHFVAGNHFGASASSVDLAFATGANGSTAERWRITSAGTLLAAASELPIEWTGNGIVSASSHLYIRSTSGGNLYFQTGGAQRWEINSSGNLIGNSGGQILYGDGDVLFPGASANLSWDKSADTLTLQDGAKVGIGGSPSELLHLNASAGGANNRVLSRAHFGGQYADHSLVLGYAAKADTAANSQMVVTETSGSGATGNPAAIRMKTGSIEFHTANSGTSGAAFDSQRVTIDSSGNLTVSNGKTTLTNDSDNALVVETTDKNPMYVNVVGSAPNYLFDVRDDGTSVFRVDGSGNVTITGDTSDAYTAGTLKLTAGNLGTNSIQLGDVSDADIGMIQYANSDNSMRFTTNGSERLRVDQSGNLGISNSSPDHPLTLTANPGAANTPVAWLHNSGNVSEYDGTVISTVNDGSDVEVLHVRTNTTTYDGGTSLLLVQGDGKVGIGSAPGSYNSNANNLVVGSGSGNSGLSIASGATSEGGIYFANGTTGTDPYNGALLYRHNTNRLDIFTDGAAKWYIDSTGSLISVVESQAIDLSGSNYAQLKLADNVNYALQVAQGTDPFVRFNTTNSAEKVEVYKNLYMSGNIEFGSGNGLDFSATSDGTGSSISELFSDYEQGSFTPVIGTSGGTINGTTHIHSARYTKIGNTVHIALYVSTDGLTDVSSASGYPRITGLPFAAAGSGHYGGVVATYSANWTKTPLGGYVSTSSTIIALTQRFSSITGQITTGAASDFNTSGGTKNDIILTGHYEAA